MSNKAFDLFLRLQYLDKNTLSCLRGDLERQQRLEIGAHSVAVEGAVHARYLEGLDLLLDLVASLEGYDRNIEVKFDFADLTEENPELPAMVDSHILEQAEATEEEATTRWVA